MRDQMIEFVRSDFVHGIDIADVRDGQQGGKFDSVVNRPEKGSHFCLVYTSTTTVGSFLTVLSCAAKRSIPRTNNKMASHPKRLSY
jgi:hypothetical protein